eukprot:m.195078 g.195078  ORF g.195078 m.195078 type:complete len:1025 (-) comp25821_c0_seq3:841-3915(-)
MTSEHHKKNRRVLLHNIKALVAHTLSLLPEDENYAQVEAFILSNFRHHRYLTPNSNEINRKFERLAYKFEIHSLPDRAKALTAAYQQFLSGPLPGNEPRSETHYALALLLLELSHSPSNAPPSKQPETDANLGFIPTPLEFDVAAMQRELQAEEELLYEVVSDDDSELWSDLESDDDEPPDSPQLSPSVSPAPVPASLEQETRPEPTIEDYAIVSNPPVATLTDSIIPSVNFGAPIPVQDLPISIESENENSSLCQLRQSSELLYHLAKDRTRTQLAPLSAVIVPETVLVRETIWMLLGAATKSVFVMQPPIAEPTTSAERCQHHLDNLSELKVDVIPDVTCSHLSPLTVKNVLSGFAKTGTYLCALRLFRDIYANDILDHPMFPTYEAFADELNHFLQDFENHLSQLQSKQLTLLKLSATLRRYMTQISLLFKIFARAVRNFSDIESTRAARTASLLTTLHDVTMEEEFLCETVSGLSNLMFQLFMSAMRPLVTNLETWMLHGRVPEDAHEFFIIKTKDSSNQDGHDVSTSSAADNWDSSYSFLRGDEGATRRVGKHVVSPAVVPSFLMPLLYPVFMAGNSMRALSSLEKLPKDEEIRNVIVPPPGQMYIHFFARMVSFFEEQQAVDIRDHLRQHAPILALLPTTRLSAEEETSELLKANFATLREAAFPKQEEIVASRIRSHQEKSNKDNVSPLPIAVALRSSLNAQVSRRANLINRYFVEVLVRHYNLLGHFENLRSVFLMAAGDCMSEFTSGIFDRLHAHQSWSNILDLTSQLHSAFESTGRSALAASFTVSVDESKVPLGETGMAALDPLQLHYHTEWPVNMIINDEHLRGYNRVFAFLLRIKRAKWAMESVNIAGPQPKPPLQKHKIQLLRAKILYVVQYLHDYVMTRILHGLGMGFQKQVARSPHLDAVVANHQSYIQTIQDRCLLHPRAQMIQQAINKILSLTLDFRRAWLLSLSSATSNLITHASFRSLDKEFSQCLGFLVSLLGQLVKGGGFPHVEALQLALAGAKKYTNALQF